jgi:hypothetical protein
MVGINRHGGGNGMKPALIIALAVAAGTAEAQEFGTDADKEYADLLWQVMEASKLVGDAPIMATPYEGVAPHGVMLETFYTSATVDGHTGALIVKRNYGPEGVNSEEVLADPAGHLGAVTVMYRRENGYDADNQDWFWVKYLPDGSLDKNPAGMAVAGRVAKGADQGCIACHSTNDDYIFTTDAIHMMN